MDIEKALWRHPVWLSPDAGGGSYQFAGAVRSPVILRCPIKIRVRSVLMEMRGDHEIYMNGTVWNGLKVLYRAEFALLLNCGVWFNFRTFDTLWYSFTITEIRNWNDKLTNLKFFLLGSKRDEQIEPWITQMKLYRCRYIVQITENKDLFISLL